MPQVPYQPYSEITPTAPATPGIHPQVSDLAFGGGQARGLGVLGHTLETGGNELFQRAIALQDIQNQTDARNADTEYNIQAGQIRADFHSKQGENAGPEALMKYSQDLRELREKIRGSLKTDNARKMYDAQSMPVMSREINAGAGHAATQVRHAENASIDASIKNIMSQIDVDPENDTTYEAWRRKLDQQVDAKAKVAGLDEVATQRIKDELQGTAIARRIQAMAIKDSAKAQEYYDELKHLIKNPDDRDRVERTIQTQNRTVASRVYADKLNFTGGPKDPDQKEVEANARKAADKLNPKDEALQQFFVDAALTKYHKVQSQHADTQRKIKQGAMEALNGDLTPDGKLPLTPDDFRAINKETQALWDNADPTMQDWIRKRLRENQRLEYKMTPEKELRLNEILGWAQKDPKAFLAVDPFEEKMPREVRSMIFRIQRKIEVKSEEDPRVNRALRYLGDVMTAAHATKEFNPTRYHQFVGAVQKEMARWQAENKKQMPVDEIQKMGSQLIMEIADPNVSTWGGLFSNKKRLFEHTLTPAQLQIERENFEKKRGWSPPDEMLRQGHVAKQYQKYFGVGVKGDLGEGGGGGGGGEVEDD